MLHPTIQELYDLAGEVALVTGGARNLGYDMATALAEAGADVAITSRVLEDANTSARRIADYSGRKVHGFACDVRFEDQVAAMVEAVLAEFGAVRPATPSWPTRGTDGWLRVADRRNRWLAGCGSRAAGRTATEATTWPCPAGRQPIAVRWRIQQHDGQTVHAD